MIHSFLKYCHLFSITQSNGDHTVRIGGVILLLCFNIFGSAGGTTDIICDPISRSTIHVDFRENAAEDVDEDACPIVGVYISLKIALGKKITIPLYKVDLMNQALGKESCPTTTCLLVGVAPSVG